jgi:putative transposase
MARLARIVIPGLPHHVRQRGNRREAIFFQDGDHEIYRDLLAEQTLKAGVEVFAELRRSEGSGRPVGAPDFVAGLERLLGRKIARRAPGRKPASSPTSKQLDLLREGYRYHVALFSYSMSPYSALFYRLLDFTGFYGVFCA